MAQGFDLPEGDNKYHDNRQRYLSFSESKSMACNESRDVNVGGPIRSCKDASINRQV